MFVVQHEGIEKHVSGFFVDYLRYQPKAVFRVLGEVVNGQLDPNTNLVHCIDFDDMASATMPPVPVTPYEQGVEHRQQQESVDQRHANRDEPSPVVSRTDSVASPTPMQSEEYWLAWCLKNLSDQPGDDAVDWSSMREDSALP